MEAAESHTADNLIQEKLVNVRRRDHSLPTDNEESGVPPPDSAFPGDLLLGGESWMRHGYLLRVTCYQCWWKQDCLVLCLCPPQEQLHGPITAP